MKIGDLVKDWDVKLLSLLLAASLWLCVAGIRDAELVLTVPLEPRNVPGNLSVPGLARDRVMVTVNGPKILLLKLRSENIIIPLDMKGLHEGMAVFTGFERTLHLPPGLGITRVFPSTIEVKLVKRLGT